MKTLFRFRFLTAILIVAMMFVSCNDDDKGKIPEKPGTDPIEVVMQDVALTGIVRNTEGNPLGEVRVTTGTSTVTTGNDGKFTFTQANIVSSRAVIKFEKQGYFTVTRSSIKENEMNMEVVLRAKGSNNTSTTTFNANQEKTLSAGDMQATVPANGLVHADGSTYTGIVNADMLYLDPNDTDFATAMPGGDLAAIRTDNSEVQLISYGMVEISLTDNTGKPLQLREGETSTLTFPIPAGMESDPPASIPLWYFDEEKGIWIEEGVAALEGDVYVGTIQHFSWHNLDVPAKRVTIKGKVTNCNDAPVQVRVTVTQNIGSNVFTQAYAYSNSKGEYVVWVPENTPVTITILPEDYDKNGKLVGYNIAGQPGGTVVTQDFSMPCINVEIKGTVKDCNGDPIPYIKVTAQQADGSTVINSVIGQSDGTYSLFVPSYTPVIITVLSADYINYENPVAYKIEGQPIGAVVTQDISLPCGDINLTWQQRIKEKYDFDLTIPEGWTFTKVSYDANISYYIQFITEAEDFEKAYIDLCSYLFDVTAKVTDGNFNMELYPNVRLKNYTEVPYWELFGTKIPMPLWYFNSPTYAIQFDVTDFSSSKTIQISINSCGNPAVAPGGTPSGEYTGDESGTGWPTNFLTVFCPNITIPQFSNAASFEWGLDEIRGEDLEIRATNATEAMVSDYGNALKTDGWQYSSIWEEYYKLGIYITVTNSKIAEGECVIKIRNVNY